MDFLAVESLWQREVYFTGLFGSVVICQFVFVQSLLLRAGKALEELLDLCQGRLRSTMTFKDDEDSVVRMLIGGGKVVFSKMDCFGQDHLCRCEKRL